MGVKSMTASSEIYSIEIAISKAARAEGIVARPLSRYYMHAATAQAGLLLGYACVANEQIDPAFAILARIIQAHGPG